VLFFADRQTPPSPDHPCLDTAWPMYIHVVPHKRIHSLEYDPPPMLFFAVKTNYLYHRTNGAEGGLGFLPPLGYY